MFSFPRIYLVITQIFLCFLLLSSCTNNLKKTDQDSEFKTLQELQKSSDKHPSLAEQFSKARKETEFLDDQTEILLNHHKKWFIFSLIIFMWLIIQSIISYYRQD